MGTDCKSALSHIRDFFTYPSDRVLHISKVKFKLKKMELVDEIINLDDYLGGALPIKEKRWSIIIEEI